MGEGVPLPSLGGPSLLFLHSQGDANQRAFLQLSKAGFSAISNSSGKMMNHRNFCVLDEIFTSDKPFRHFFGTIFFWNQHVWTHFPLFHFPWAQHFHCYGSDFGNSSLGVGQGRGLCRPWLAVVLLLYMEQDLLASGEYDYCVKRLMASRHVEVPHALWVGVLRGKGRQRWRFFKQRLLCPPPLPRSDFNTSQAVQMPADEQNWVEIFCLNHRKRRASNSNSVGYR